MPSKRRESLWFGQANNISYRILDISAWQIVSSSIAAVKTSIMGVRRSIQLKNSDQRFGIIQRRGQGKRLLENDARAVSCELPLGLIPNSACEQNRSPISEWLAWVN